MVENWRGFADRRTHWHGGWLMREARRSGAVRLTGYSQKYPFLLNIRQPPPSKPHLHRHESDEAWTC